MSSLPLPTYALNWDFKLNQLLPLAGSGLLTGQQNTFAEKTGMISATGWVSTLTSPWIVAGSSNSVAGAMDAVDRWVTSANLIWANNGSAHSWIVLENAFGLQLLIDLSTASGTAQTRYMSVSMAGFTGGSNASRPTATDENVLVSGNFLTGTAVTYRLHQWNSQNGTDYRMTYYSAGVLIADLFIGVAADPVNNWVNPYWALSTTGTSGLSTTTLNGTASARGLAPIGNMTLFFSGPGWGSSIPTMATTKMTGPNGISGLNPLPGIGLASGTAGAEGLHGVVNDVYWALNNGALGLNYPKIPPALAYTWAQVGGIILPTNNTQLLFT